MQLRAQPGFAAVSLKLAMLKARTSLWSIAGRGADMINCQRLQPTLFVAASP
jgi:hypothetical protein